MYAQLWWCTGISPVHQVKGIGRSKGKEAKEKRSKEREGGKWKREKEVKKKSKK